MISQETLDDAVVKPLTGALWVAIVLTLLEGLPKTLRRLVLLGLLVAGTLYLDRRLYGE